MVVSVATLAPPAHPAAVLDPRAVEKGAEPLASQSCCPQCHCPPLAIQVVGRQRSEPQGCPCPSSKPWGRVLLHSKGDFAGGITVRDLRMGGELGLSGWAQWPLGMAEGGRRARKDSKCHRDGAIIAGLKTRGQKPTPEATRQPQPQSARKPGVAHTTRRS